jgi:hypothetical protein
MPSQISGQAPKASKLQNQKPQKPKVLSTRWATELGNNAAKSAGHAAHDIKHGIGKAIDAINPFD